MSQVSIIDIEGNNPQIPTEFVANIGSAIPLANVLEILGDSVAAGSNPVQTTASGNTLVVNVQTSQSIAASDATKIGLAAFNSSQFTVDANGFVGLIGGSAGIDSVATNVGGPVFPDGTGQISILGTIGIASSAPLRSNGTVANTVSLVAQVSSAQAGSSINNAGMASFNSSMFTVDGNGYVSLIGGSVAVDSVAVQTGTSPVVPTAAGLLTINGAVVAAGTNPLRTNGTGANTLALEVQTSQALAAADATKIGLSNFSSTDFAVTATGFVTLSTTGAAKTITGDSGGALSPTANNWNILGSGSITTVGAVSTLTVQLTGLTNHAVLVGAGTSTITKLAVGTNGQLLTGSTAADPVFATPTSTGGNFIAGAGTLKYIPANYMPACSNLGITYSGGTFTVNGFDGTALSSTNPGYVTLQSKVTPGRMVTIAVTANQTFTDGSAGTTDNARFGVTTGVNWTSDMPFYLYGVIDDADSAIAFMISRLPGRANSPPAAQISKTGAIVNVSQGDFFSLADVTIASYDSNPCLCLGSFRMQFVGATDSWTVQTLSALTDGIGNFSEQTGFSFVVGQNGATAAKFMIDNGGTAPAWSTQVYQYYLSRSGLITLAMEFNGDGGTDGAGAVAAQFVLPLRARLAAASNVGIGCGYILSSVLTAGRPVVLTSAGSANNFVNLYYGNTFVLNSDFGNGNRTFGFSGAYLFDVS